MASGAGNLIKELQEEGQKWHWWIRFARMFSFRLEERSGGRINPETGLRPSAELFWKKYIYQGRRWARFWRILVVTIVYFLVGRFIIQSLGSPRPRFVVRWPRHSTWDSSWQACSPCCS